MAKIRWRLGLACCCAFVVFGCVAQEQRAMIAAQEAYDNCAAESSGTHPDCDVLQEKVLAAQRRYEESARRAWGCDPAREECPRHR